MIHALKQFWWFITFRCYNCGQWPSHHYGWLHPVCPCWFRRSK